MGNYTRKIVNPDGTIKYYNDKDQLHRTDGAAIEYPNEYFEYYIEGEKLSLAKFMKKRSYLPKSLKSNELEYLKIAEHVAYIITRCESGIYYEDAIAAFREGFDTSQKFNKNFTL